VLEPSVGKRPRGIMGRLIAWLSLSGSPDPGQGSLGNGGAMRVAPVGGYFADDLEALITAARASAEVTHAHPDGMAGAVAVAATAAWAWRCQAGLQRHTPAGLLDFVLEHTPDGPTRAKLVRARALPADTTADQAALELGNGTPITSAETVPFTLWCAARDLADYEEAFGQPPRSGATSSGAWWPWAVGGTDSPQNGWRHASPWPCEGKAVSLNTPFSEPVPGRH
jgi:ADP-ribosylglycohydrolase